MWSTPCIDFLSNTSSKTPISSDFDTRLSPSGELDFGIGAPLTYEPNTFRPGRFEKLANALENEFSLGFSTTDPTDPSARQPNSEDPSGSGKVASQPSSAFSAPEYGLDSIEGSYVIQGLRPKQGTHAFSSRFQQLLDRKLQAEAAAKSQQQLLASQQAHKEAERACSSQYPSGYTINTQLSLTSNNLFTPVTDSQAQQLSSSLLGQLNQAMGIANYPKHSNMRDVQNSDSQRDNSNDQDASRYPIMSSADAYSTASTVPPNLGPPAVQPSYQPAPIRSQHYQRLLAAKLANSGQADADTSASVANDGAAFMQHWADHTLDPNYPTPQEMSFLPSSHSPLYQLFNSGYAQDQWQPSVPYPDASARNGAANGNVGEHAPAAGLHADQATPSQQREMWPVNQLERVDAAPTVTSAAPYFAPTESNGKYTTWLNPFAQPVEDSDAASNQSSRAPGQTVSRQAENIPASSANPVLSVAANVKAQQATSIQNTVEAGRDSSASPPKNEGNGLQSGADGADDEEPKKATLACHFCRGRKLKCDGTRPTCAHCEKRGLTCSYDAQIRRRGPGKRKREQMAMLAAAEGKVDEDGTPLLHKLLAPKPKGKRGRKPKNRNPEGESSSTLQVPSDQGAGLTGGTEVEETPYARPPNPYLPSYFIPDQSNDYPLLGPPHGIHQAPPAQYLSHPPQTGNIHMELKREQFREHQPMYQPSAPQHHPHAYYPGYHTSAPWPEDLDSANKRQRTEQFSMSGRW